MIRRFERLTLADLTNLAVEGGDTPMHQGALGVLDGSSLLDENGRVNVELVRDHIAARLDRVPLLRRRLWRTRPFEGRPLWVDDPSFRIENHVLVARLPEPGGERMAIEFAQDRMSGLMDRSRPLWQIWLLEGYGAGRVGLFLKLHHVLADGGAILNIVALLFDLMPGVVETSPSRWTPGPPPRSLDLLVDNVTGKVEGGVHSFRRLRHPGAVARSAARVWRGLMEALEAGRHTARTSLNGRIGTQRVIGVLPLDLAEVKAVAHEHGVKVNDVMLDLIASGLRRVLEARGEPTRGVEIHVSVAVRLAGDARALGGNHSGTMIVPLELDQDEGKRLASIGRATTTAKREQQGGVPQALMALLAVTGLTRFFIRRQHMVHVLATNLAGPQFPLYVAGARLLDAFAITPVAGNVTAAFAALSYDGRLDLSVDADAGCWPDLGVLIGGMEAGWHRLTAARRAA